jgi:hypothetical protein
VVGLSMTNEELYFFAVSLSVGFVPHENYIEQLNNAFLLDKTDDALLLELQFCTNDMRKTIDVLNAYLYDKISTLNYDLVAKMILTNIKNQYDKSPDSIKELTHSLYDIYSVLPYHVVGKEPFFTMSYIDDAWDWGDYNQIKERFEWLINFYT